MTNIANSTVFPNPDTYLNHLSPSDAREFEVCRNITLAVFGVRPFTTFISVESLPLHHTGNYLGYTHLYS